MKQKRPQLLQLPCAIALMISYMTLRVLKDFLISFSIISATYSDCLLRSQAYLCYIRCIIIQLFYTLYICKYTYMYIET